MVMKIPRRSGVIALITIAFCTADSWAARTVTARLTIADNKVSVAGQAAGAGATIAAGDTIVTGSRSRAELTLADGTVVRIGQGSSFTFTGSKLVLNQGSVLLRIARKNTAVVAGSRSYTGGPAVVSAQASKGYDGLFVLQGGGNVNGMPLIAGQTSVLEKGKDRTFSFDLQKLVGTSSLVTKFPQTPWIAQTEALASLQHQLLAGKIVQAAQSGKSGQQGAVANATSGLVSSRVASQPISKGTANLVSTGAGGVLIVNGNGSRALGGTLSVSGSGRALSAGGTLTLNNSTGVVLTSSGSVSLGSGGIATIDLTKTGLGSLGGTLQISNPNTIQSSSVTLTDTINAVAAKIIPVTGLVNVTGGSQTVIQQTGGGVVTGGTLTLNGGALGTSGTTTNVGTLQLIKVGTVPTLLTNGGILTVQPGTATH